MRYIFWILILLNLGAFLFFSIVDTNDGLDRGGSMSTGIPLVMLQEKEPPPLPGPEEIKANIDAAGAEDTPENKEPTKIDNAVCYSLAPFEFDTDAQPIVETLNANDLKSKIEEVVLRIPTGGYWVFLPPYESRDKAKRVADELAKRGVADYYILTGGEYKNAISLGLYSGKSFAEKRARIIRSLGYDPIVSPRYRVERHFAVKYQVPTGFSVPTDLSQLIEQAAKGARQEIIDCVSVVDLIE